MRAGLLYGLLLPIYGYRYFISPWLGVNCRFTPSCSAYAIAALRQHGILRGSMLAIARLGRCHPWGEAGYDPIAEEKP